MRLSTEYLPLQRLWHWERSRANAVHPSQSRGDGRLPDFTWKQVMADACRMGMQLQLPGEKHDGTHFDQRAEQERKVICA
jgi:long-chain acyl-CoA synthetase